MIILQEEQIVGHARKLMYMYTYTIHVANRRCSQIDAAQSYMLKLIVAATSDRQNTVHVHIIHCMIYTIPYYL